MAATVSVIATRTDDGHRAAMTATSVTCVAMDPPSMLVCINRKTAFHPVMTAADNFSINILAAGQDRLASACGGGAPAAERFGTDDWSQSADGTPFVAGGLSALVCRKVATWDHGTHTIIVGNVVEVHAGPAATPLVYQGGSYRQLDKAAA
jgi:flavin reductase (DIM6/NTAB) family NADH-FMN oxidoreductase RutF